MKHNVIFLPVCFVLFGALLFPGVCPVESSEAVAAENPYQEKTVKIFKVNCTSCHGGMNPSQELNLEAGKLPGVVLDVPSTQKKEHKLIDTKEPQKSYILMKINNDRGISGKPMPLNKAPLTGAEIKVVEQWIRSVSERADKKSGNVSKFSRKPVKNPFLGTRLINLPTPLLVAKGRFLFRVSHRFYAPVKEGFDLFFGLDGPVAMSFGFAYGVSPNLNLTLGRSNLFREWELMLKWRILSPSPDSSFPLSLALHTGSNWASQEIRGESAFDSRNVKFNVQFSFAYPLTRKISLLLVPGYSSNVNHYAISPEGSFALGSGIRMMLKRNLSIVGEWLPVLSGYKTGSNGWGLGLEYKIGKHLFQVYILNTAGLTVDQYMGGGDLLLTDGEFRLGFSIFREF
ncbi:DUF5777 family beta-barrel protein [Acidobacteriota bacterium]